MSKITIIQRIGNECAIYGSGMIKLRNLLSQIPYTFREKYDIEYLPLRVGRDMPPERIDNGKIPFLEHNRVVYWFTRDQLEEMNQMWKDWKNDRN